MRGQSHGEHRQLWGHHHWLWPRRQASRLAQTGKANFPLEAPL